MLGAMLVVVVTWEVRMDRTIILQLIEAVKDVFIEVFFPEIGDSDVENRDRDNH